MTVSTSGPTRASESASLTVSRSALRNASQRKKTLETTPRSATRILPRLPRMLESFSAIAGHPARRLGVRTSDVQLEAVVGQLERIGRRQLTRAVGDEEALRARCLERLDGFVEREVTAGLAVEIATEQR